MKLEISKWVEIEIGLGSNPSKFTLGSNGLNIRLGLDLLNLNNFKENYITTQYIFSYSLKFLTISKYYKYPCFSLFLSFPDTLFTILSTFNPQFCFYFHASNHPHILTVTSITLFLNFKYILFLVIYFKFLKSFRYKYIFIKKNFQIFHCHFF